MGNRRKRVGPIAGLGLLLAWWACAAALDRTDVRPVRTERALPSQEPHAKLSFTHLSVADGLSHADVRAIVQDRQGFMWFGTWLGGLDRYDGYTFKVYKHDASDKQSLSNDSVRKLYLDRNGVLWVGTNAGVDRYDPQTDSFIHYNRADDGIRLPHFFYEDKSGALWLSSDGGLSRFDQASGRFYTYRRNPNDPTIFGDTTVWPICEDKTTGLLWLGSDEGLTLLDRSSGHFSQYKNNPKDPRSLSSSVVVHIFQDRTGTLWVSTARGLNRFDRRTRKFIRYLHDPKSPTTLSDDYVVEAYEDRAGRFWVATNNGLNLMDRSRGTFTRYQHDPDDPSSLSSNVINPGALYEDPTGTLWIGTRSTGIDRLAAQAKGFNTYRHKARDANSPSSDAIGGLALDLAGELWIGTEAGLDRFDGRTFRHYLADPNDPRGLTPGPQRMVAQDANGAVWTGTYGGGLDQVQEGRVKHFRHDPKNPDSPANDTITSLLPDSRGGLWIGNGKGMDYFDGWHFTHFSPDPTNPASLPDGTTPLLLDQRGMLWSATPSMGLVRFDPKARKSTIYLLDPTLPGIEAANRVQDIYFDGASLWVAASTGLFRFDPETGEFTRHYTEKDGLASNTTVGVLGDAKGNVWVSNVKGLSKFEPRTETFRNYDAFDGLQGNEFSLFSRAKAPDGRLYFGGVNGLSAFYPDMLLDNPNRPPVVLTEFEVFNEPARIGGKNSPLQQAINTASSITLHYDQSVFRFQFAALNYTAPEKNQYAYRLDPFDRGWQYTDATRRFATYTHLDPGSYTFRVKASNNDGVWNEQGVAIELRILPPWWGTWWFRALCASAALALLWGLYQLRIRELGREEQKFREAVETMPALAFVVDRNGNRTFLNLGWLEYTGLSPEQATGSGWQKVIHPDDLKRVLERWRDAQTTGEPLAYEARIRQGSDGAYRWFQTRARPLRDKRGNVVKWCAVANDIEDRKQAEQLRADLAHVNRVSTLGEMAASLAHEIKQPIAATITSASSCRLWLGHDPPNVDKALAAVNRIEKDGNRAASIIDRLRSLYKKAPPQREAIAVNEVIGEMAELLRGEAHKNAVSMRPDLANGLPMVMADRVQIQQVLMNLMLNGIEAMKETGGVLTVKSELGEQAQVMISVTDTGVGLPPEKADQIFNAFFTSKPQGSGMGLAISRSIVESHGGRICATANDGRGAAFHFTLPVAAEAMQEAVAGKQADAS